MTTAVSHYTRTIPVENEQLKISAITSANSNEQLRYTHAGIQSPSGAIFLSLLNTGSGPRSSSSTRSQFSITNHFQNCRPRYKALTGTYFRPPTFSHEVGLLQEAELTQRQTYSAKTPTYTPFIKVGRPIHARHAAELNRRTHTQIS